MDRATLYSGLSAGVGASLALPRIFESLGQPGLAKKSDGRALSEVLAGSGVPAIDVEVIRAGEETGRLEETLKELAERARVEWLLRRKILNAVLYPVVVLHAAAIIPWVFAWIVFGASPLSLLANLGMLWAVLGGAYVLFTSSARDKLPIVGDIARRVSLARFCETFASGVRAAVPLRRALELAAAAAGGGVGRRAAAAARSDLGRPLVETLDRVLPPLDLAMLEVGEESGSIDRSLLKIAQNHRDEAAHRIAKITAVLPIVLFLVMGAVAAFVIFTIGLPDMAARGVVPR
ncbi:MAG: type II secretion system F family protein [Planctomycetes bacterium]|nr:type II secretion system F family protein [Planctomycetota bacterium]